MPFISAMEEKKKLGKQYARRGSTQRLSYCVTTYNTGANKDKKFAIFAISPELQKECGFKYMDYANVMYNPDTKEGFIQKVAEGGWQLSISQPKKGILGKVVRLTIPFIPTMQMPEINPGREVTEVSCNPKGIYFKLDFKEQKKK